MSETVDCEASDASSRPDYLTDDGVWHIDRAAEKADLARRLAEARGMVRDVVHGRPLPMVIRCACPLCLARRRVEYPWLDEEAPL